MQRIEITPKDEADWLQMRLEDITSTDIAALFSISPYKTKLQVWLEKSKKESAPFEITERIRWGSVLQDAIANEAAVQEGWTVTPYRNYGRIQGLGIGSSFDFSIEDKANGAGILEVKNVDSLWYSKEWTDTAAPLHIELQLQHQMLVSGRKWGVIAALVGGNTLKTIHRKADLGIQAKILSESALFWDSIREMKQPDPEYPADAATVSAIHSVAGESVVDASGNEELNELVQKYRHAANTVRDYEELKETAKAEILQRITDAKKVTGIGWTISASNVEAKEIPATMRNGYRTFRINFKK